ncbi:peroxiredoxin, partial [Corallococcus exiguus]|nr:peroxiredoxin [Corallococcus exiguus]
HHEVRVYRHLDDVLKYLQAHPTPGSNTASA